MVININVTDKHASVVGAPIIVCGNSDYKIHFTFDEEWENRDPKTARFVYRRDGAVRYIDIVFTGDTVTAPVLFNTKAVQVGVFAGDLQTSTPARIPCELSVRCGTGAPHDPTPDQYDQIMALLNTRLSSTIPGVADGSVTTIEARDLEGVTEIRNYAFYGCENLETVVLPETLTNIGTYAFYNCAKLKNIELPDSLTTLGARCFMNCKALERIVIPEGVTTIPTYCFNTCTSLDTLILVGDTVKTAATTNILSSTPIYNEEIPIYIATINADAAALAAEYANASNWSDYYVFAPISEYKGEW